MKISLTISRFEGENVILKDGQGQEIFWPKNKIPEEYKEGSALIFAISTDTENNKSNKLEASDILNEILDIND